MQLSCLEKLEIIINQIQRTYKHFIKS